MNKVANTYWDNVGGVRKKNAKSRAANAVSRGKTATPNWFTFAVIAAISFLLCLTINFRAFSEMRQEATENEQLNSQIENLSAENAALEQEVDSLKSDPKMIEREARRIGMGRPNEKILVPGR